LEQKLLQIKYTYNGGGDPKGYGRMTVYTVSMSGGKEVLTAVQEKNCTTKSVNNFNSATPDSILYSSGSKKLQTDCTMTIPGSASIDVSQMEVLYLQMDIPKKDNTTNPYNPSSASKLKSNDPATSNHLYLGGIEVAAGKTVDIFTAVPCGTPSSQAWEDGGNALPADVSNADFFYKVTGKCDFSQRPVGISLTQ
jgi:hypothetical protein